MSLQTPSEHAFCSEISTVEEMLTRDSCPHVQLISVHERVLCFLHHHKDELKSQDPNLLNTFCTNSYLDIWKTACWFQILMKDTWKFMPQSHCCHLTVPLDTVLQGQANEHLPGNLLHWDEFWGAVRLLRLHPEPQSRQRSNLPPARHGRRTVM